MPRRLIYSKSDIWKRRQANYARYFEVHTKMMMQDIRTRETMLANLPKYAEVNMLGEIEVHELKGQKLPTFLRLDAQRFDAGMDALIQCLWSEAGWNEYISMFNALPDPLCPYYAHYNAESDEIEYNPVDKSGTSPVLLSTSRAVVPNLHEKRA